MNETSEYSVGQRMILVRDRHDPEVVEIARLTKTRIVVRHPDAPNDPKREMAFKQGNWMSNGLTRHAPVAGENARRYNSFGLYDHSDEALSELQRRQDESARLAEERKQAEQERLREIAEREAAELTEVKELCGGQIALMTKASLRQPDGSRVYVLDCPVHAGRFERKHGWEMVVVYCKDVEELDWKRWAEWRDAQKGREITEDDEKEGRRICLTRKVEFTVTRVNGGSCSFSSCSSCHVANDEEALWTALHWAYTS